MRISRSVAPLFLAALVTTGLVACAPAETPEPTASAAAEAPAETDAATAEPEETAEAAAPTGVYVTSAWANPVTSPGELLTTVEATRFKVEIFQVGTAAATATGQFVDADTNTPLIEIGDTLVFVNYVVTNTSDEILPLSYNLVGITPRYDDWAYGTGMDSVVDRDLFEQMQINNAAIAPSSDEVAPFPFGPGESFSFGVNFEYQPGSPITIVAGLTPADEAGDLVHDQREEVEVSTTIK